MSCTPEFAVEGPDITLIRNTKHTLVFRAYQGRSPLRLIAGVLTVKLVVSTEVGAAASVALTLASTTPAQITIHPEDDGTFTVTFAPATFATLPESVYKYAIFAVDTASAHRPLTLPANLLISESIGPAAV